MQVIWRLDLKNTAGDGLASDSHVTNITFLQELEALCLTATQGELLLVHSNKDVEEVFPIPQYLSHGWHLLYISLFDSKMIADWPN